MHKKVSVIVPVYNAERFLNRFMKSLLDQTMPPEDFEIILVDDGSKDDSGQICDTYAGKYENVTAMHQENAGPAAARNAGLKRASGDYVAFVDPDDLLEAGYLEVAYSKATESDADILLFDAYREKEGANNTEIEEWRHADNSFVTDDPEYIRSMQRQILYPYMAAQVSDVTFNRNVPLAAPWDKLYRRSFIIGKDISFPENLRVLDDMCFNFRAFGESGKIAYFPAFLYRYKVEGGSITNSYRADRVSQDVKVFDYLEKEIDAMAESIGKSETDKFKQAYYARVIKSFAISLRLCFFNPNNPKASKEVSCDIKKCLESLPYKEALRKVSLRNLEPKLVAVTIACRLKAVGALKIMYKLQYER